jgi:hypothetical protein
MLACVFVASHAGCHLVFPDVSYQPIVRNPFPQLSRIAVAPFFNQSDEPTVDGRKFALAYFAELQATAGYEVVPLGVVEEAIIEHRVDLSSAGEARRLASILGVDALVVGSVTDYTPYYPPRCGLRVEWYAANPGFHEIPPGYGLPWGTPEEEFIPESLVFEAEMALAKAQLATQTPACEPAPIAAPVLSNPPEAPQLFSPLLPPMPSHGIPPSKSNNSQDSKDKTAPTSKGADSDEADATVAAYEEAIVDEELPAGDASAVSSLRVSQPDPDVANGMIDLTGPIGMPLPPNWPNESSFIPPPPSAVRPPCVPTESPVMTHTRIYSGHDEQFTAALANYYYFRTDARFGGWQNYLQRSDDFIRFCCHMHISEMLSARGGADQTRVVWRWSDCR